MAIWNPTEDQLDGLAEVEGRSLWEDARRRLMRNKAAVASVVLLAIIGSWPSSLHAQSAPL